MSKSNGAPLSADLSIELQGVLYNPASRVSNLQDLLRFAILKPLHARLPVAIESSTSDGDALGRFMERTDQILQTVREDLADAGGDAAVIAHAVDQAAGKAARSIESAATIAAERAEDPSIKEALLATLESIQTFTRDFTTQLLSDDHVLSVLDAMPDRSLEPASFVHVRMPVVEDDNNNEENEDTADSENDPSDSEGDGEKNSEAIPAFKWKWTDEELFADYNLRQLRRAPSKEEFLQLWKEASDFLLQGFNEWADACRRTCPSGKVSRKGKKVSIDEALDEIKSAFIGMLMENGEGILKNPSLVFDGEKIQENADEIINSLNSCFLRMNDGPPQSFIAPIIRRCFEADLGELRYPNISENLVSDQKIAYVRVDDSFNIGNDFLIKTLRSNLDKIDLETRVQNEMKTILRPLENRGNIIHSFHESIQRLKIKFEKMLPQKGSPQQFDRVGLIHILKDTTRLLLSAVAELDFADIPHFVAARYRNAISRVASSQFLETALVISFSFGEQWSEEDFEELKSFFDFDLPEPHTAVKETDEKEAVLNKETFDFPDDLLIDPLAPVMARLKTYPVPAIIQQPWSPAMKETTHAKEYWNGVVERTLVRFAQTFTEQCQKQGISFPSTKKADAAHAILRHVFRSLENTCKIAITDACKNVSGNCPTAHDLQEHLSNALMNFRIPDACPPALRKTFESSVQQPLWDAVVEETLLSGDASTLRDNTSSWDAALAPLFTPKESLSPSDMTEVYRMLDPLKSAFTAAMLKNMIDVLSRRESAIPEGEKVFVVSTKEFSTEWIPIIHDAVSTAIDAYADQQPTHTKTIREFLERHFTSIRQRTLFTRIGSAAAVQLRNLGENAPAEELLVAMRRSIEAIDIDSLTDEPAFDLQSLVRSHLLGPRDTTLLPEEHETLLQFCRNTVNFTEDISQLYNAQKPALRDLAEECNRNYHAGFPCRTGDHFKDPFAIIVEQLRNKESPKITQSTQEQLLPPDIAELAKICDENEAWIAAWPREGKKDKNLAGFLQEILHRHHSASDFIEYYRITGSTKGSIEEAKLNAEYVALARDRKIIVVREAPTNTSGKRNAGKLKIHEHKMRDFLDWRRTREQAIRAAEPNAEQYVAIHPDAHTSMDTLWKIGVHMQLLSNDISKNRDERSELAQTESKIIASEAALERAKLDYKSASLMLEEMQEPHQSADREFANNELQTSARTIADIQSQIDALKQNRDRLIAEQVLLSSSGEQFQKLQGILERVRAELDQFNQLPS